MQGVPSAEGRIVSQPADSAGPFLSGPDPGLSVLTDFALLERFLSGRDEAAFAALVGRHGPMVRATCRRALGDTPDAEDAFQAVFLVLLRKAGSISRRELLGPWLHTVAVRTAGKVRARAARRQARERQVTPMPEPVPLPPEEARDWLPLLDEELRRLPEPYRRALILCDLQAQGRSAAAHALGVAEGTLSSRLARGRELLRRRLVRRGFSLTALALGAALTSGATAAVPPPLALSTTQAALTGSASASVAALTEGVLHTMFVAKLKWLALAVLLACALVASVPLVWALAASVHSAGKGKSDKDLLQGSWQIVDAEMGGKKAEGEEGEQIKKQKLVVKGNTIKTKFESEFTLDEKKTPREINVEVTEGPAQEVGKWRGIYELKGDDLKICISLPGGERPKRFATEAGEQAMLLTLKRDKGGAKE
jgi:RNA polymerase sigma factor (sigma-70 family)